MTAPAETAIDSAMLARWELHFAGVDPLVVRLPAWLTHAQVLNLVPSAIAAISLG